MSETGRPGGGTPGTPGGRRPAKRDDAALRHDEVGGRLSGDDYREAARETFEDLGPEDRVAIGRRLRDGGRDHGASPRWVPADDADLADPAKLAHLSAHIQQQRPGLVPRVVQGDGTAEAALRGIADHGEQRLEPAPPPEPARRRRRPKPKPRPAG